MILRRPRLSSPAIRSFSHHTPTAHDRWIEDSKRRLRSFSEIDLRAHANAIATRASSGLSQVGRRLNEITGYDAIEELKNSVIRREQAISALKLEAREAKRAYETAVAERSACQRQVNDLLQRKSSWSEADVGRFTALVRQDHINEQEETRAKEHADATELLVESEFSELMRSILNRYHEEQIWSDKIRSASTYGSLAALGLNLIVFILAIVVVEPWKRKRLGETFEKRIVLMEKENQELVREGLRTLSAHFERQEEILTQLAAIAHNPSSRDPSPHETSPPESTANTAADRLSHILPSDPNTRIMTIVAGAVTFSTAVLMYLIRR